MRLLAQLNVVIPLVEAAPAAHLRGRPLPPEIPAAVRDLAAAVEEGRTGSPVLELPAPHTPAERAVDSALRHAATHVFLAEPDPYVLDDRLGRPAALRVRARHAVRDMMLSRASWRYGLRLALCIGLAQSLVSLIEVERSYWVALTVTFVLKPDFGSVFSRAVLRALGTALGLVIAAAVLAEVPRGWWDVPVMMVLAALIPAFSAKGYAFQTAAITPVILLLSDLLNHQGFDLIRPRLVDSLIGCAIVLVMRLPAVARELAHAHRRPARPHRGRRRPVRGAGVRRPTADGGGPAGGPHGPPPGTAPDLPRPVGRAQRVPAGADRTAPDGSAGRRVVAPGRRRRTHRGRDHRRPRPRRPRRTPTGASTEVDGITRRIRALAEAVRSTTTPVRSEPEPTDDESSVLSPLHQELAAARAITDPGG